MYFGMTSAEEVYNEYNVKNDESIVFLKKVTPDFNIYFETRHDNTIAVEV